MKKIRLTALMALLLAAVMMLAGCSKEKDYLGTYVSAKGTTLVLKEDGKCKYTQLSWDESKEGTWKIEDDKIIVSGVLDYEIYAELGESTTSLLFESDSTRWNDETLIKTQ